MPLPDRSTRKTTHPHPNPTHANKAIRDMLWKVFLSERFRAPADKHFFGQIEYVHTKYAMSHLNNILLKTPINKIVNIGKLNFRLSANSTQPA